MRIEAAPSLIRLTDRRQRSSERRAAGAERRASIRYDRRARHPARPWLTAEFGAQILGQIHGEDTPTADTLARTYAQTDVIVVGIVVYALLGLASDQALRALEGRSSSLELRIRPTWIRRSSRTVSRSASRSRSSRAWFR